MRKILRFQIGLRWFLGAVLTIGIAGGLIGKRYVDQWRAEYPLRRQKEIAQRLQAAGAKVEINTSGWIKSVECSTAWPRDRSGKEDFSLLAEMPQLRVLQLNLLAFDDDDAVHLRELTNLSFLSLERTRITDRSAPLIGRLKDVSDLSLANTMVGDGSILHLRSLGNLDTIYLSHTRITNEGVRELSKMTWLGSVMLAGTRIDDRALYHLARLPLLSRLVLDGTDVRGTGLIAFQDYPSLNSLHLSGMSLEDSSPLAQLDSVGNLYLEDAVVTAETLRHVADMNNLGSLSLAGATLDDGALAVLGKFPEMYTWNLRATGITDEKLVLLRGITGNVDLQENQVTEAGVSELLRHSTARITFADNHVMDSTGTLTKGFGRRGPPRRRAKFGTLLQN